MKTKGALLALMIAAFAGAAWASVRGGSLRERQPVRLGALLPLTGPDAAFGKGMKNAMRLAVDEVNRRGGLEGRPVELVVRDDASTVARAEAAAAELLADPLVIGVLPHYDSDCSLATQPIFGGARMPSLPPAVMNREPIQLRTSTEFRILPPLSAPMKAAAAHAWQDLGARRFVFVRDDSDFGLSMVNGIRDALTPYAGKVVTGEEMVRRGEARFEALVVRIVAAAPDLVYFGGRSREAGALLKQLRGAGFRGAFFASTHQPDAELIEVAGSAADGALAVFHGLPDEMTAEGRDFRARYAAAQFAEPPTVYGLHAYAAAQAMLAAAARSFLTRPSLAGALGNEELPTALGPLRFNYFGSTYRREVIYRVERGAWRPVLSIGPRGERVPVEGSALPPAPAPR